ncbi:MAG: DUF3037 domain-containing protein [Acidobacteriota bacterium]|nr:DUF3037 domain-containing protein [Acidobacteriota bacterium]
MPALSSFDYAVLRVVPRVDREEFLNAGIILFCLERRFLCAQIYVDESRLHALCPDLDLMLVRAHLEAFAKVCHGEAGAGPMAQLSQRERFHWLVAPRSTMIQVSPVHSGLCESPQTAIEKLVRQLVQS